ncbi:hypothetical protein GCM10022237_41130 [Nocardioides ginsengisoli]|uniref:WXG100 family type VII secretion target n=1 Tax=Nocardioides ginsengisoli TaxID=363868 RepID=A0ABW3W3Q6_9ACTN
MAAELSVELSDLRGWGHQVRRAGGHCTMLSTYVATNVPDGDFGRILSLIQGDYESMATTVREALSTDGHRLDLAGDSLHATMRHFADADADVAQSFGLGARITDDGSAAAAFSDGGGTTAAAPTSGGETLPEVSFGWLFDKACELISWVGGPDLRSWVTEQIAGDVDKASTQASAWANAATAMRAVEADLDRGERAIERTWTGDAATAAQAYLDQWLASLRQQASSLDQIGSYLHDMVQQAVEMAQVVVDIVKEIISIISAGWSMASIPIYGQIKLVDKVKDAIKLVNDARKVITVFWNALKLVVDGIKLTVTVFTSESLPAAPALPGAVA